MEQIAPKFRATAAMLAETTACGIGIMLVSSIGYFFSNWVAYYYVLSTLFLLSLPAFARMPPSFRWYFSKKYVF